MGKLCLLFLLIGAYCYANEKRYTVDSPDRKIQLTIIQTDVGELNYQLFVKRKKVIDTSELGFKTETGLTFPSQGWKIEKITRNKMDSVWKPLWGKRVVVPDKYNEIKLCLVNEAKPMDTVEIAARAYNEGMAFRYALPQGTGSALELTTFNFAGDYIAWFYNGERHNIGPERLTETDGERLPVMTVKAADDLYMAVHEACLYEGEPLKLNSKKGECSFSVSSKPHLLCTGYQSAWREVLCGNKPGDLVDSHLLELLNPEPAEKNDFSWVKPGIALWDWRINGAQWNGFNYTMSYPSWERMVDFAAEQEFAYLVLDANWYGPEFEQESNPVEGDKARDVQKLIQYGKQKGVGIWLYLNDVGGRNYPLERTLKQYGEWGATGVKYGFMAGSPEEKNSRTKNITEICARYKLLVDFHDYPVHPYGQMRTWPNAVTREYCKAQLDGHEIFYPKTFVTSVFVNMIAGPIDMNNGMFDLRQGNTTRLDNNQEVPSTVVSEAARTLITFSGVTIIPDIPEFYRKYPALLRFLSAQKMPWLESKTLDGRIGEYIVMMRQAKNGVFLIGAATNEEGRNLHVPLSFLGNGEYKAEIVEDGENAHYLSNRETIKVSKKIVNRNMILNIKLAPGGGTCIRIGK